MARRKFMGRPGKTTGDKMFFETARDNTLDWRMYYDRLTELSISVFDWKNLPDSIDPRFLELCLFSDGQCLFFKDEVMGYLTLRCMIGGLWDVYQIPTRRTAYASNGYHRECDQDDSVIIYNNMLHTNSMLNVELYAKRLWEYDKIIDINAKAQKTPVLISCDESQRLTMKNLYMKYEGNQPFIFGDKNINPNSLKVLNTEAPYIADKVMQLREQVWSEALTYLGIVNIRNPKKERMITGEISSAMGGVVASRFSRLQSRKQACEQINKMFGLDIDVDFREEYLDTTEMSVNEDAEEKPGVAAIGEGYA